MSLASSSMYPQELHAAPLRSALASEPASGRYSMVPPVTGRLQVQDEMAEAFLEQMSLEGEIERLKQELAHRIDFTCLQAWQLFNIRQTDMMNQ